VNMRTDSGCLTSDANVYCQVPADGLASGNSATLSANWVTIPSNVVCVCPENKNLVEVTLTLTGSVQGSNRGIQNSCNGDCVADQNELKYNITLPCIDPNLILIKDDCETQVCVGSSYTFNYTISNPDSRVGPFTMVDVFPAEYEVTSGPANCIIATTAGGRNNVTCTWSSIVGSVNIAIGYRVTSAATVGQNITNCAQVSGVNTALDTSLEEDCDTNLVITCGDCKEYGEVCTDTAECCSPLQCLRHAAGDCNGTATTSYRCVIPGGALY